MLDSHSALQPQDEIAKLREAQRIADEEFELVRQQLAEFGVTNTESNQELTTRLEHESCELKSLNEMLREESIELDKVLADQASWDATAAKFKARMTSGGNVEDEDKEELLNRLQDVRSKRRKQSLITRTLKNQLVQRRKQCLDRGGDAIKLFANNMRIQKLDRERHQLLMESRKLKMALTKAEEQKCQASDTTRNFYLRVKQIEKLFQQRNRFGAWLCDRHATESENLDSQDEEESSKQKEKLRQELREELSVNQRMKEALAENDLDYSIASENEKQNDVLAQNVCATEISRRTGSHASFVRRNVMDDDDTSADGSDHGQHTSSSSRERIRQTAHVTGRSESVSFASKVDVHRAASAAGTSETSLLLRDRASARSASHTDASPRVQLGREEAVNASVVHAVPRCNNVSFHMPPEMRDAATSAAEADLARDLRSHSATPFAGENFRAVSSTAEPHVTTDSSLGPSVRPQLQARFESREHGGDDELSRSPSVVSFNRGSEVAVTGASTAGVAQLRDPRDRISTPFAFYSEHGLPQTNSNTPEKVSAVQFTSVVDDDVYKVPVTYDNGSPRSCRGRIATPHFAEDVVSDAMVRFTQEPGDVVDASCVDEPNARTVRGRIATPFYDSETMSFAYCHQPSRLVSFATRTTVMDADPSAELREGDNTGRQIRTRLATPYYVPDDALHGGVSFNENLHVVAAASETSAGRTRPVRGRVATPFCSEHSVATASGVGEGSVLFCDNVDVMAAASAAPQQMKPVRNRIATPFGSEETLAHAVGPAQGGVSLNESAQVAASASFIVPGQMRSTRDRIATPFVLEQNIVNASGDAAPTGVRIHQSVDVVPSATTAVAGQVRPVRDRVATPFATHQCVAMASGEMQQSVSFGESVKVSPPASSEVLTQMRSSRDRIATPFISEHHVVDTSGDAQERVRINQTVDIVPSATTAVAGQVRPVRDRVATPFASCEHIAVASGETQPASSEHATGHAVDGAHRHCTFDENPLVLAAASNMDRGDAHPVAGRLPTPFFADQIVLKLSDTVRNVVNFEENAHVMDAASTGVVGHAKSIRDRIATPACSEQATFSASGGIDHRVAFDTTVDVMAAASIADLGRVQPVRDRVATPFLSEHTAALAHGVQEGGVSFNEHPEFMAAASTVVAEHPSSTRDRTATPFFRDDITTGAVGGHPRSVIINQTVAALSPIANAVPGQVRSVRDRRPTSFASNENAAVVSGTAEGNVSFNDTAEVAPAASSAVSSQVKSTRDRIATPFFSNHTVLDPSSPSQRSVRIDEIVNVVPAATNAVSGQVRPVRDRVATPFFSEQTLAAASGEISCEVSFDESVDIVASPSGALLGPAKSTRDRKATPFFSERTIPDTTAARQLCVRINKAVDSVSAEPNAVAGPVRSAQGRVATPFVSDEAAAMSGAAEGSVRFNYNVDMMAAASHVVMRQANSTRDRIATPFFSEQTSTDASDVAHTSVKIDQTVDVLQAASSAVPEHVRPVRDRRATPFVSEQSLGVVSGESPHSVRIDQAVDIVPAASSAEPGQMKTVRGRAATPFIFDQHVIVASDESPCVHEQSPAPNLSTHAASVSHHDACPNEVASPTSVSVSAVVRFEEHADSGLVVSSICPADSAKSTCEYVDTTLSMSSMPSLADIQLDSATSLVSPLVVPEIRSSVGWETIHESCANDGAESIRFSKVSADKVITSVHNQPKHQVPGVASREEPSCKNRSQTSNAGSDSTSSSILRRMPSSDSYLLADRVQSQVKFVDEAQAIISGTGSSESHATDNCASRERSPTPHFQYGESLLATASSPVSKRATLSDTRDREPLSKNHSTMTDRDHHRCRDRISTPYASLNVYPSIYMDNAIARKESVVSVISPSSGISATSMFGRLSPKKIATRGWSAGSGLESPGGSATPMSVSSVASTPRSSPSDLAKQRINRSAQSSGLGLADLGDYAAKANLVVTQRVRRQCEINRASSALSSAREMCSAHEYAASVDFLTHPRHPDMELHKHEVEAAPTDQEKELLVSVFRSLDFCTDMSCSEIDIVVEHAKKYEFKGGECIVREGDTKGTHFFIVGLASKCLVAKKREAISVCYEGMTLGTSVLLSSYTPRSATVIAWKKASVWAVKGSFLRDLLTSIYMSKQLEVWNVLNALECLQQLTQSQKDTLCEQAVLVAYEAGDVIIDQNDVVKVIYLRASGEVEFFKDGERLTSMDPRPDFLGVESVFIGEEAEASERVQAKDDVMLLSLNQNVCQNVFGGRLRYVLSRNKVLRAMQETVFNRFSPDVTQSLLEAMDMVEFAADESVSAVIDKYDIRYFVVTRGNLVIKDGGNSYCLSADQAECGYGEEYVLDTSLRFREDIIATEPSLIAYFTSDCLRSVLKFDDIYESLKFAKRLEVVQNIFVFSTLPASKLHQFVSCFVNIECSAGEILMHQGDENGETFYILHDGSVNIMKDGKFVKKMGKYSFFGERALLYNEPRTATIICDTDCKLWVVQKAEFLKHICGPIIHCLQERINMQETKIELSELRSIRVVGRGGFGVVKMMKHKVTGIRYALKSVIRKAIVQNGLTKAIKEERNILAMVDHPFIIKFVRSFKTHSHLHFLTELVTGGELFDALNKLGLLNVSQTRYYVGSIVLALEYLHEKRIVYRDLKSENILIDHQGFIRIIDFGLAKKLNTGRTYTFVGTPYFMAPEVILGKGYGTLADIFSLGVCMYDFMTGVFPFGQGQTVGDQSDLDQMAIFKAIMSKPVRPSQYITDENSLSFLHALLQKDPRNRIGASIHGFNDIKKHPYFNALNWDDLIGRMTEPPYIPVVQTVFESEVNVPRKDSISSIESSKSGFAPDSYDPDWVDPDPDRFAEF